MKIIYHHRTRGEDAQGVHISELQAAWRAMGHELVEVSLGNRTSDGGTEKPAPKPGEMQKGHSEGRGKLGSLIYEFLSFGYNVVGAFRLWQAVRRIRPAFIYERHSIHLVAGAVVSRLSGVPLVLEVNAPLAEEMAKQSGLVAQGFAEALEHWVIRKATRVVVVTDVLRQYYAKKGLNVSHFEVMHNGVDPARFNAQVSPVTVRERHNLQGRCVVGFVGWVRQWHRLDLMIDALSALPDRDNFAMLVVGDGPAVPALREQAERLGMGNNIVFAGPVRHSEIPDHVAAMDITVLPSIPPYASPMKLFEYMALGKAVVVPDQPNLREVVRDGENGLCFPVGDYAAFAACVLRLAQDNALRARMGQGALRTIEDNGHFWRCNAERVNRSLGLA
jgi:glycosyltransferase involved in cell wall biosynthesis